VPGSPGGRPALVERRCARPVPDEQEERDESRVREWRGRKRKSTAEERGHGGIDCFILRNPEISSDGGELFQYLDSAIRRLAKACAASKLELLYLYIHQDDSPVSIPDGTAIPGRFAEAAEWKFGNSRDV
jgi:hypothetical protein